MKALVFGGSSVIGSRLVKALDNADYTYFSNEIKISGARGVKIDVRNKKAVIEAIKELKPDVVIHGAAAPSMDICETDKELAHGIHLDGTKNIIEGCAAVNAKIILLSTSAVFDGKKRVYTEQDEICPISYYGVTKAEAEKIVSGSGLDFLIARMDHPYGWVYFDGQKRNTAVRVLEKLEKRETVEEITDWYNNPTFIDNLTEIIKGLVENDATGVYHTAGPDFVNRYEFAVKIAEIFGKDTNLVKKKTSDKLNLPAKRTSCNLDSSKAEKKAGMKFLGIENGLKAMRDQ